MLRGGAGDDVIDGGRGNDTLYGGDGADVFEIDIVSGHDVIGDFVDGEDLIHFVTTGLGVYAITADGDDAVLQLDSNGANTIRI